MISFQKTPNPRNYLSRREQWRLLLLVMSLGLAVVLMIEARKPENWWWITVLDDIPRAEPKKGPGLICAKHPPGRSGKLNLVPFSTRPSTDDAGTLFSPELRGSAASGRYFRGVKPTYLESIRDDTTFCPEEKDAWFHLFAILNNNDDATFRKASAGRVTRAQLLEQSNEYRGELVTVGGTVRRAFRLAAPRNEYGVPGYYQVWVQPDDNRNAPIVAYCLYLPEGFPIGMNLDEEAEIVGFYFKRWPYKAVKTIEIAPTLLARTIEWRKRPVIVKQSPRGAGSVILVVGVALVFSVLVTAYIYFRTRGEKPVGPEVPTDLDALAREDEDEE